MTRYDISEPVKLEGISSDHSSPHGRIGSGCVCQAQALHFPYASITNSVDSDLLPRNTITF